MAGGSGIWTPRANKFNLITSVIRHHRKTILSPIPDDWTARSVSSPLADDLSGNWGDYFCEINLSVLRGTNFTDSGNLNLDNVAIRGFTISEAEQIQVRPYDILIERSGGCPNQQVGRIAFVPHEMPKT